MTQSLFIILGFVFRLGVLLFLIRFLLQAAGADFYNPLSQAIVKASDPICRPLRRLLPAYRNLDFASVLVAWVVALLFYVLLGVIVGAVPNPLSVLLPALAFMLTVLLQFYFWSIIIMVIASFVGQGSYHPALALLQQLVEPVIAPVRKILPPLGPLDLSPAVVMMLIVVLENALGRSMLNFAG